MNILDLLKSRPLILDGAMGTTLMAKKLGNSIFGAHPGCFDYLVESAPEVIGAIHEEFLTAGCDIIETCSFSATANCLAEHGLAAEAFKLNEKAAALAKKCAAKFSGSEPHFVSGSIGPGNKLASLGQIDYQTLYSGYREQVAGLISGGVDLIQIETCQDLLQIKAAVNAALDTMRESRQVPIYVSLTLEKNGTLLTGPDVPAIVSSLAPLPIDIIGFNCSNGPAALAPYLRELAGRWPRHLGFYPNAGLPLTTASGLTYPETPEQMAQTIDDIAREIPLAIVGGCCGTSPSHIAAIAKKIKKQPPPVHVQEAPATISSLYQTLDLAASQPILVAERTNATGSKVFREKLLAGDLAGATAIILEQENSGAKAIDLSVAYTGLDEVALLKDLTAAANREAPLPLVLDSTNIAALEAALQNYGGRALINSINLEDGGVKARQILALAQRYGAAVLALTIDETGMAKDLQHKMAVAGRLIELAGEYGLKEQDLFIDFLTFTLASGEETLKNSAKETLAAIKLLHVQHPKVATILGLSNISFGLNPKSRPILNSVFLAEGVKAGLTAAIVNPAKLPELKTIPAEIVKTATNLIYNKSEEGDPLELFIKLFSTVALDNKSAENTVLSPAEEVRLAVIKGRAELLKNLPLLLKEQSAENILNNILLPAMSEVGDLMAAGKLPLPFVLKSAQVMSLASEMLKEHFSGSSATGPKFVLATVRGDVHDIGKNLVKMILSNNGIQVIDLGIKVSVETVVSAIKEQRPAAVGLSGLLVSSAQAMLDYVTAFAKEGFTLPVLVGGAALTPAFVHEVLAPAYPNGQVFYCKDAFDDLSHLK